MKIILKSVDKDVQEVPWRLEEDFKRQASMRELVIVTEIKYNIRGIDEVFLIEFDYGIFLDIGKNNLREKEFKVAAVRQLHISNILEGFGTAFFGSVYATFIISIGVNPFKSKPSFWIFVSMMQMLSYIPVLNCNIPCNLEFFLTKYFGLSKSSIPFDSLPSWLPNPKKFIAKFETDALNSKFENAGYTSISFIYNFGDQLGTWIILLLLYILINIAGEIFPTILYKNI